MVIRVLDYVEHCISYADGDAIFRLLAQPMSQGEDVVLSFDGVDAVPSSFVNAAILRLTEVIPVSEIKEHLSVVNSTRQINEMIRDRVAFVARGVDLSAP